MHTHTPPNVKIIYYNMIICIYIYINILPYYINEDVVSRLGRARWSFGWPLRLLVRSINYYYILYERKLTNCSHQSSTCRCFFLILFLQHRLKRCCRGVLLSCSARDRATRFHVGGIHNYLRRRWRVAYARGRCDTQYIGVQYVIICI